MPLRHPRAMRRVTVRAARRAWTVLVAARVRRAVNVAAMLRRAALRLARAWARPVDSPPCRRPWRIPGWLARRGAGAGERPWWRRTVRRSALGAPAVARRGAARVAGPPGRREAPVGAERMDLRRTGAARPAEGRAVVDARFDAARGRGASARARTRADT